MRIFPKRITNFAQLRIFDKRIDNLAENVFGEQIVQQGCKRLQPSLVDYQKSVSGSKKPHIKRDKDAVATILFHALFDFAHLRIFERSMNSILRNLAFQFRATAYFWKENLSSNVTGQQIVQQVSKRALDC